MEMIADTVTKMTCPLFSDSEAFLYFDLQADKKQKAQE
jgi:hypothetical protein